MSNYFVKDYLDEKRIEQAPTREGFGKALVAIGEQDERVVGLTGDLSESTRMDGFQKSFPERFFEVGVAEQNMMGIAAGLALSGKIPFITSYATFSPGRNWDQLRVSVCYSDANVKVIGCHSGLSVGPDGATHQALEDIAITRVLPNLIVVAPADSNEAYQATIALAKYEGPAYMRLTREKSPVFTSSSQPFVVGKAIHALAGDDVTIITAGPISYEVLQALEGLSDRDITCDVIFCPTIKPLDQDTILKSVRRTKAVVTVEEHQIDGGLGSAVCELLAEHHPVPVERVGMPNSFGQSGQPNELWATYGLTRKSITDAVKRAIKRKSS
ncbi:MAG TPA: transketolase C-terminal domain-containing protein [Patescibacteria group bacterium]